MIVGFDDSAGQQPPKDEAATFLARTMAWRWSDGAYIALVYTEWDEKAGRVFWRSRGRRTLDEVLRELSFIGRRPTTRDIYVAMSTQASVAEKVIQTKRGPFTIVEVNRSKSGAVGLKSLFFDVDVKAGAYATTEEALAALEAFLKATGLPRPTLIVASGSGGFHCHWVLDRILEPSEWLPLAVALKNACEAEGLMTDVGVTTDAARILRIPGTLNHKWNPPRPVRLLGDVVAGDYPVELQAERLKPYANRSPMTSAGMLGGNVMPASTTGANSELTGGVEEALFDLPDFISAVGFVAKLKPSPWATSAAGGSYDGWKPFVFACAFVIAAIPVHAERVRRLFGIVAAHLSRDAADNSDRLERAVAETAARLARGELVARPASVFKVAIDNGWQPPVNPPEVTTGTQGARSYAVPLTVSQETELDTLKSALRATYSNGRRLDREKARGFAAHFLRKRVTAGLNDGIARRLALSFAYRLVQDGWALPDVVTTVHGCGLPHADATAISSDAARLAAQNGAAA